MSKHPKLQSSVMDPAILWPAIGNAFNRFDFRASSLRDGNQATVDQLAVNHHRTRAAFAFAATFFCAGQVQFFAEHVQQTSHRPGVNGFVFAVDGKVESYFFNHSRLLRS